ncbi:hypothetical protein ACTXJR_06055 [Glutamicibacter ardleyensis]|uniref:hypothetical protein n=1 Tax=Glutamicibacter ardleyensis TaxID=225894 RepID=UPI003FD167AB
MNANETNASEIFEDEDTDFTYEATEAEIAEAIAQCLAEIKEMNLGFCKSFSELHDHIDANELGGFCDNRYGWTVDAMNRVQDAVSDVLEKNS